MAREIKARCSIDGCSKPVHAHGLCSSHDHRLKAHGDPLGGGGARGLPRAWLVSNVNHNGEECLTWPFGVGADGYGRLCYEGRDWLAHRLMCHLAHGDPPTPKHTAAHSCGKGHLGCTNPNHLSWKTRVENEADKLVHGTLARGERNGHAKISEAQALEIVALKGAATQQSVAERFGISQSNVSRIQSREKWAWLRQSGEAAA